MAGKLIQSTRRVASPLLRFADGFLYFFRGFWFLFKNPVLWPYAVMPFVINLFIVAVAVAALAFLVPKLGFLLIRPQTFLGWAGYVVLLAAGAVFGLFAAYFLFFMLLPGLTSPVFKGKLTRRTRQLLKKVELRPAGGFWIDVVMPTLIELRKALRFLLISLALLPLNLVPVVGQIAYLAAMSYFTWYDFALNYLEYPIDSEAWVLPLNMKRKYLRSRLMPALGLGCAISLTCLVPFLNFFCVPVGVVGATLLYQAYGEQQGLEEHRKEGYVPWLG